MLFEDNNILTVLRQSTPYLKRQQLLIKIQEKICAAALAASKTVAIINAVFLKYSAIVDKI